MTEQVEVSWASSGGRSLWNLGPVDVAHVIDHLVLPCETIFAATVTTRKPTVVQLERCAVVSDSHVPLQVGLAREPEPIAGTWFVQT